MKNFLAFLILILPHSHLNAQNFVHGTVKDNTNQVLPGAVIRLEGTTFVTVSGSSGEFRLNIPGGKYILHCTYLGYNELIRQISVPADSVLGIVMQVNPVMTEEITVAATRTGANTMSSSVLDKQEIERLNTGRDVPYLLQLLPSVVVTSDAGNGVGYTGIRIRGTDQSRINVTINGIPLNDAESQQVYWVDLPDFASSTENIQVQRGVGSSTNGASAFGGSINLLSNKLTTEPFAQITSGYGSFSTFRNTVSFGTGQLKNNFSLEGRLSKLNSDGYVDRAHSDLKSFYLSGGYSDKKTLVRLNVFSGKEITYQSWYGVPEARFKNDIQGVRDYIDRNYLEEDDAANLLNSGRTYNYYTYDNQVDDYGQDHYQLHLGHALSDNISMNFALHYTRGKGFYEEYEKDETLSDYGMNDIVLSIDTITESDLIQRKWLGNHFYGAVFGITSVINSSLELTAGGGWNRYEGKHFGEVIWARFASDSEIRHRYYDNDAEKTDANAYIKANYKFNNALSIFADAQIRNVSYSFTGYDENGNSGPDQVKLNFFNPKAGILYDIQNGMQAYLSVAVAQKEPNRDDYTESSSLSRPHHEYLTDFEGGFRIRQNRLKAGINAYYMLYKDQLVLTGQVNDVGNYTRVNIDDSYRAGIEIEAGYALSGKLAVDMNLTLSQNRINNFRDFTDTYDVDYNYSGQDTANYKNTPIAFSPELTSMGRLTYQFNKKINIQFIGKHVGEQYLDNTGSKTRMLDDYTVLDVNMEFKTTFKNLKELRLNLLLCNITGTDYAANGYTWGYNVAGERITENFYYPQALFNYMAGITLRF
jgi:iron complex outermembrane receptor protein